MHTQYERRTPRRPRDAFLPLLERIVTSGTAKDVYEATWSYRGKPAKSRQAWFRVEAIYLFGSFARGAPTCGDLDIIVVVDALGDGRVPDNVVKRVLFGSLRQVDVRVQDLDDEEPELDRFPEHRLLWSRARPDWRRNVAAIDADPLAGRQPRKSDRLPIRLHRLAYDNFAKADALVDRIDRHEVLSSWLPFHAAGPDLSTWSAELVSVGAMLAGGIGADCRYLVPSVLQVISEFPPLSDYDARVVNRSTFELGGCYVSLGRPVLDTSPLLDRRVSALLLAPYSMPLEPPGVWLLKRGPAFSAVTPGANL